MGLANGKQEMQIKPNKVRFDDNQWHKVSVHRRIQEVITYEIIIVLGCNVLENSSNTYVNFMLYFCIYVIFLCNIFLLEGLTEYM